MEAILSILAWVANLLLPDRLAYWLAEKWAVNDYILPSTPVDHIVPVAHGATVDRLVNGSVTTTAKVLEIGWHRPESRVSFGFFAASPDPSIEREDKREAFHDILAKVILCFGPVWSTIQECIYFKNTLPPEEKSPKRIVVVSDEAHSRRCRIVWRCFFPDTDILVVAVPLPATIDRSSPMETYHNPWKALIFQAVPTPVYWWWARKGPEYLATKANLHQPVRSAA